MNGKSLKTGKGLIGWEKNRTTMREIDCRCEDKAGGEVERVWCSGAL